MEGKVRGGLGGRLVMWWCFCGGGDWSWEIDRQTDRPKERKGKGREKEKGKKWGNDCRVLTSKKPLPSTYKSRPCCDEILYVEPDDKYSKNKPFSPPMLVTHSLNSLPYSEEVRETYSPPAANIAQTPILRFLDI